MYKVLLADNGYLSDSGMAAQALFAELDLFFVGTARSGKTAANMIYEHRPDIVLSAVSFSDMTAVELMEQCKGKRYKTRFIILGEDVSFQTVRSMFRSGAYDFWRIPLTEPELILHLKNAVSDVKKEHPMTGSEMDPAVAREMLFFGTAVDPTFSETEVRQSFRALQIKVPPTGNFAICLRFFTWKAFDDESFCEIVDKVNRYLLKMTLYEFGSDHFKHISSTRCKVFIIHPRNGLEQLRTFFEKISVEIEENFPFYSVRVGISQCLNSYKEIVKGLGQSWQLALRDPIQEGNHVNCQGDCFDKKAHSEITRACDFIVSHYMEDITVREIAESLFISPSYLMHLFKEVQGCTINEYLTDYRVKVAKMMLESGQYRIAEIAQRTGYRNTKYFSRVFQKETGLTPSEFLKTNSGQS